MVTPGFDIAMERLGVNGRENRRSLGWCDTCTNAALPGLHHCGKCLDAVPESEPLKAEVLSMQLPEEMELRDWFAGMALIGLGSRVHVNGRLEQAATECYQMADAMLAAREAIRPDEESAPQKYPLGYEPRQADIQHDFITSSNFGET